MKKSVFFITMLILSACQIRDNPVVKIYNYSNSKIDSILIYAYPNHRTVFTNINQNESRKGIILVKNISKNDGCYNIEIYKKGIKKSKGFGYFTNGASLDYGFKIIIENDTIKINDF